MNISFVFYRFGYATNTKVKFVVVLQSSNASFRDNDVRMVCKLLMNFELY